MRRALLFLAIVGLLINPLCSTSVIAQKDQSDAQRVNKIRSSVTKLGIGFESRVKIKFRDQTEIRGYVSEISKEYFVVVVDDTHVPTKVSYSDVIKLKCKNYRNEKDYDETFEKAAGIGLVVFVLVALGIGYARY